MTLLTAVGLGLVAIGLFGCGYVWGYMHGSALLNRPPSPGGEP